MTKKTGSKLEIKRGKAASIVLDYYFGVFDIGRSCRKKYVVRGSSVDRDIKR